MQREPAVPRGTDGGAAVNDGRDPQAPSAEADEPLLTAAADEVFAALGDRTRRRILVRIADRPDDAGSIARDLDVSRQAVAKQLRILEQSGLVDARMQARRRVHAVAPGRIREVSDLLGVVARGWDRRLVGIKELAERHERGSDQREADQGGSDQRGADRRGPDQRGADPDGE